VVEYSSEPWHCGRNHSDSDSVETFFRWLRRGTKTVGDQSQGVRLAKLQDLVRYWGTGDDWRTVEKKLNTLPMYVTRIDGIDIQFIHVGLPSQRDAVDHHPAWPGSIVEQLKISDPLTKPTAHGGRAEDAFEVIISTLPGYGFSGKPTGTGWGPDRVGLAREVLMKRLGYTRYVAQGGDWVRRDRRDGATATGRIARRACQPAGDAPTKWM